MYYLLYICQVMSKLEFQTRINIVYKLGLSCAKLRSSLATLSFLASLFGTIPVGVVETVIIKLPQLKLQFPA